MTVNYKGRLKPGVLWMTYSVLGSCGFFSSLRYTPANLITCKQYFYLQYV